MSVCRSCSKSWPTDFRVCPDDGTSLSPGSDPTRISSGGPPGGALAQPAIAGVRELAPGTVVGEYTIEGKLGEGGMATVYAATHPVIGKKAAIKVISPSLCTDEEALKRFRQEARSVNQIGHLHIVDVFSFG